MAKSISGLPLGPRLWLLAWAYPLMGLLLASVFVLRLTTFAYLSVAAVAMYVVLGVTLGRKVNRLVEGVATDSLTRVLSRAQFESSMSRLFPGLCRRGDPLALLIVDVDQLKAINDAQGHRAGDEALRLVGESLRRTVRASDLVARYGGDEFVVVAPKTSAAVALALAQRLRFTLRRLATSRSRSLSPTVSIGVAATGGVCAEQVSKDALFDAADQALYLSKHNGRDCASLGRITWPTPQVIDFKAERSRRAVWEHRPLMRMRR